MRRAELTGDTKREEVGGPSGYMEVRDVTTVADEWTGELKALLQDFL